jgi:hypothetical protein
MRYSFLAGLLLTAMVHAAYSQPQANRPLSLQTYLTAAQVEDFFSTPEKCATTIESLQTIGISKVYLETVRSGFRPQEATLRFAIQALQEKEISVAAGIATIRGQDFGTPSNQPGIWLNYQSEKTAHDLREHVHWVAGMFDEIIVDDFLATDDESEASLTAKQQQSWAQYRLQLMTAFSKTILIPAAKNQHPQAQIILKYPQWYDRFHRFGYNVLSGPELYDRIWVGTETRNPDTKRFGFTQATQGYNNYTWLQSIAQDRMGGAWFDFGDCTPLAFRMQAYQSILAGASELVLFEAGSLLTPSPCLRPFLERREALSRLHAIVYGKEKRGLACYKPPHSEGSDTHGAANLYVYDYLGTLGLSPVMTAFPPLESQAVFLSRQSADNPAIRDHVTRWIEQQRTILFTPDFLSTIQDKETLALFGFTEPLSIPLDSITADSLVVKNKPLESIQESPHVRPMSIPKGAELLVHAVCGDTIVPLLTKTTQPGGAVLLMLNLATFTHEEFGPNKEQFLPPRPLSVTQWPEEIGDAIRNEILYGYGLRVQCPNRFAIHGYEDGIVVFANFTDIPATGELHNTFRMNVVLHPQFPHADATQLQKNPSAERYTFTVAPWELMVIHTGTD